MSREEIDIVMSNIQVIDKQLLAIYSRIENFETRANFLVKKRGRLTKKIMKAANMERQYGKK